ncbi:MAG: hypothetical protein ACK479_12230 [Fluviicola sp.]
MKEKLKNLWETKKALVISVIVAVPVLIITVVMILRAKKGGSRKGVQTVKKR